MLRCGEDRVVTQEQIGVVLGPMFVASAGDGENVGQA